MFIEKLGQHTHDRVRTCEQNGKSLSHRVPGQALDIPTNPAAFKAVH